MIKCFLLLLTAALLFSCNSNSKHTNPVTDTDVANAFIRDLLDNNIQAANDLVLPDESNKQYFDIIKTQYAKKSAAELEKYKNSDIIINEISYATDTVCIVNYSNSYNREAKNKVKVVRVNNKWLVDLKYTFSGNM